MKIKPGRQVSSLLLAIAAVMVASNIYTLIPIYDDIAADLGISSNSVSFAGSLFTCFYAAGLLVLGSLASAAGYRNILVYGLFFSSAATFGVGLAEEGWHLWAARSIQGFALSSFAAVAFAYIFEVYQEKDRTRLIIVINTGFLAAGIVGQLLSSTLEKMYSWISVFHFTGASYFVLFLFMLFFLPRLSPNVDGSRMQAAPSMLSFLKHPVMAAAYLISLVPLFSVIAFYDSAGRLFTGTENELLIVRAVGLIGAVFSLFTGLLISKYGAARVLVTGFSFGSVFLFLMVPFHSGTGLIVLSVFYIGSISIIIPSLVTLIGSLAGNQRAKALSIYSFLLLSGASLAPAAASLLTFTQILALLVICFVFSAFLSLRISKAPVHAPILQSDICKRLAQPPDSIK